MRRLYLTKMQKNILRCMAENNGRAEIRTGTRWSTFRPGYAHIFGQGFHCMLHNEWITSRGANQPRHYAWTEEGKLAYERGWYYPQVYKPIWQREKPFPAGTEA